MAPPTRDTIPVSGDRQLLDAVLDAAASLIVVADPYGSLVRWNRACEQLMRIQRQRARGARERCSTWSRAAERPTVVAACEALKAGESPVRTEFHWRTRDGELRLIEWSNTALTGPDGAVTHMVGTGIDVTETREWAAERGGRGGAAAPHRGPRRAHRALSTGAASSRSSTATSRTAAATAWTARCS